jgi:ubiquinone/menaquinone biosynthesis C-methylase UbiE
MPKSNKVIDDFGEEWERFDFTNEEELSALKSQFERYVEPLPKEFFEEKKVIADFGAGTGRWSYFFKEHALELYVIEPSMKAFQVAKNKLSRFSQVTLLNQSVESNEIQESSLDLAVSLGVLHHIQDTGQAIKDISSKIKPGGIFLCYLYYALDNKPFAYRFLWKLSDFLRKNISNMPKQLKTFLTDLIAIFIYFPLARTSLFLKKLGVSTKNFPLHHYENLSFYVMRNDALDRFGTTLEQRFTQPQIVEMLREAGFTGYKFSEREPFWTFTATKKP